MTTGSTGRLVVVRSVADLVNKAHSLRFDDARAGVDFARQAVSATCRCRILGPADCDRCAGAWAVLGNLLRISGDLREAGHALEIAETWRLMGSGVGALEIQGLQFRASLAIAGRRLEDAKTLLRHAESVAITLGDGHEQSRARVKRAIVATYRGDSAEAVRIVQRALQQGEWTHELRMSAFEILMSAYALAGEPVEAARVWLLSAALYEGCGDLMRLKLRWVRGLIAAQMFGSTVELQDLQREYAARDLGYNAALVGLDLAFCAAQAGDSEMVKARLDEAEPILRACGVSSSSAGSSPDSLRALRLALSAAAPQDRLL